MTNNSGVIVRNLLGVYFGLNMLQVPDPKKVASLYSDYNICEIRLSEPNKEILNAFVHMDVGFTFDIPNMLLMNMSNNFAVQHWFDMLVKPYISSINLRCIVVGEEGHDTILPIMKILQNLLHANSLSHVQLTTIISYTSLIFKDPPSSGAFHPNMKDNLRAILIFLAERASPILMVKLYPFKKYVYDNKGIISIDYATFGVNNSVRDGPLIYHNLFDAMVDTIYAAIEKLRVERLNNVKVVIGETGWPTDGHGVDTNIFLASKYNKNFIARISSKKGTPRRPNSNIQGFIRSILNEDARPKGESQYYGLFRSNFTPVYPLFHPSRMDVL